METRKVKVLPGIFADLNQYPNALFVLLTGYPETVEMILHTKASFPDGERIAGQIGEIGTTLLERIQELGIFPDSLITNNTEVLNEAMRGKSPLVAISLNEALFQE